LAAAREGTPADVIARLVDAGLGFPAELRDDVAARSAIADAAERIGRGEWSDVER
jgi:fructuronate reductase